MITEGGIMSAEDYNALEAQKKPKLKVVKKSVKKSKKKAARKKK